MIGLTGKGGDACPRAHALQIFDLIPLRGQARASNRRFVRGIKSVTKGVRFGPQKDLHLQARPDKARF